MFTIKERDSAALGSNERLHEAEHVEIVWPGPSKETPGASNWDEAGIYLDPEPPQWIAPEERDPSGREFRPRMAKHVILFGGDQTSAAEARKGGRVWIMSSSGATVATYEL